MCLGEFGTLVGLSLGETGSEGSEKKQIRGIGMNGEFSQVGILYKKTKKDL